MEDQGNATAHDIQVQLTVVCEGSGLHRTALAWLCSHSFDVWLAARIWQQLHLGGTFCDLFSELLFSILTQPIEN